MAVDCTSSCHAKNHFLVIITAWIVCAVPVVDAHYVSLSMYMVADEMRRSRQRLRAQFYEIYIKICSDIAPLCSCNVTRKSLQFLHFHFESTTIDERDAFILTNSLFRSLLFLDSYFSLSLFSVLILLCYNGQRRSILCIVRF